MARKRYSHFSTHAPYAFAVFVLLNELDFLVAAAMCCLTPQSTQRLTVLSPPFFSPSRTRHPQYDKLSTDVDMAGQQPAPERIEQEAGFPPAVELYGLFSSPGKATNNHEEQQVSGKGKGESGHGILKHH
jgi:hypothetical protein